jgi:rhamnose utilization protein RhaD (predicted bifunctional aldolase and dehydrogenase)
MSIEKLVRISHFYGRNPEFLMAGGGNTSFKDNEYVYVKASGIELASVKKDDFVKLKRDALEKIWEEEYPVDVELREKKALSDLMNSRAEGESRRPSVESLLHAVLPQKYIIHTHPTVVNGLTCSKMGRNMAKKLFNEKCMWIPSVNPGYTLAKTVRAELMSYKKRYKSVAGIVFLGNHGMFVGAETLEEVKDIHNLIMNTLKKHIVREPDFSPVRVDKKKIEKIGNFMKDSPGFSDTYVTFKNNVEISKAVKDEVSFRRVHSAYTPDHIVYAGPEMLFIENPDDFGRSVRQYRNKNKCDPKIIALRNVGVFAMGNSEKTSNVAMSFFLDALKISIYAESFGGHKFMDKEQIDFIKNWEVEKFRAGIASHE